MQPYFTNITQNDNVLTGSSFNLGSVSIGASTFINIFLLKNDSGKTIYDTKVYLDIAETYQGNKTAGEDINEILNIWPTLVSNNNETCGLYMYKSPYNISSNELNTWMLSVNTDDWYRFGTIGTYTNPIILPSECILNGTEDGIILSGAYAQLVFKFVVPNLDSMASMKCCKIAAIYKQ